MSTVLAPPIPMVPAGAALITAEEFMAEYSHRYAELVRGYVREVEMPSARHGEVCSEVNRRLANFVKENRLGRICCNDSLFLVRRDPDTMRGPDVSYYSFARMPAGPAPQGVCKIAPELAVEVRSPSNTWTEIYTKVGEYLKVGVSVVLVLDPDRGTASLYRGATGPTELRAEDTLTLPDVLPGFKLEVAKFFE